MHNVPQFEIISDVDRHDLNIIEYEWEFQGLNLFLNSDEIDQLYINGSIKVKGKFHYFEYENNNCIDGIDYIVKFVKIS